MDVIDSVQLICWIGGYMTAFQRTIICFGIVIGFLSFFTSWHTPDMTIVYPDNCVFVIDHFFSRSMQFEIKDFIDKAYKKNKSPSNLLPKIESHFPAIKSVVIDMSSLASSPAATSAFASAGAVPKEDVSSKALNFTIQAYQPVFLLNDEHVVCQYGKMFSKDIFAQSELLKLENISFDGAPTPKKVDLLMSFFESLSNNSDTSFVRKDSLLQEFSVRWIDKHAIWLDSKQEQDVSLLVGYNIVPTQRDVMQCRKLRGQIADKPCKDKRGKPCKNNMKWVCDLRFDQQIVLFSTNKGV